MTGRECCPWWCRTTDHAHAVAPGDDEHLSAITEVPVVHEGIVDDIKGNRTSRRGLAATLDLVRFRGVGDTEEWLSVGAESVPDLALSTESAIRLAYAILAMLTEQPERPGRPGQLGHATTDHAGHPRGKADSPGVPEHGHNQER